MPIKSSQTGSEISARKKEKIQLLGLLKNSINVFIFGPHGIGKTTLIKNVAEEYADRFGQAVYVDCLLYQTANAILREMLFSLGSVIASKSNYDLAKRLREKTRKVNLVAILDHAENLRDYEILKFLFGLNIPVCLVSNNFVCYKKLSSSMKSRIPNMVKLQNPSKEEVLNIIKERAGSVEKRLLDEIAEKVEGNITLAVNLLESIKVRNAGRCLIQDFFSHENKIKKQLNEDCKTILRILKQKKKLPGGELFRLYKIASEFPKSERSFRKYMQALCKRGLVRSIGEKKGRLYEIIGNERIEGAVECLKK